MAFALLALVVGVGLTMTVVRQFGYGLEYDEAYLLHVVKNLADGRGYVDDGISFGTSGEPFEPRISTGPTVLVPAAGAWWLSDGVIDAVRIVPLLYFLLLLISIGWLFFRAGGPWAALAALAGLLALPVVSPDLQNTSLMPGRLVGELPATALLVASAALLAARHPLVAGLVAGLAVLTKLVFLIPVGLLLLTVVLWSLVRERRDAWRIPLWFLPALVAPLLAFEAAKLVILGTDGYRMHREQATAFITAQEIEEASADRILSEKPLELGFQVSWSMLAILGLVIVSAAALLLANRRPRAASRSAQSTLPGLLDRPWASVAGLALGAAGGLMWWLLRSAQTSGRPALPSVLLLTVIAFGLLGYLVVRLRDRTGSSRGATVVSVAALLTVLAIGLGQILTLATDSTGRDLMTSQQEAAAVLVDEVGYVPADSYWTHPDLMLLSDLDARQPGPADPPYAIRTSLQARLEGGWSDAHAAAADCGLVLHESRDVIICTAPSR